MIKNAWLQENDRFEQVVPRVLLAGTNSGCGKTTVVCGVLQALVNRKMKVGAFKCGPDYIDSMFHSEITGAKSANLDLFFFDGNTARYLMAQTGRENDLCVIEGVMGYYDGLGLTTTQASSYEVAQETDSPVVLIVDAKGAALSVLATIHGFLTLYPDNHIQGVILNRCSSMAYPALEQVILERFRGAVRPLGYLPQKPEYALESRHLGLVTAEEVENLKEKMSALAQQVEQTIDLDGLLHLAETAAPLCGQAVPCTVYETPVRIGVARDRAFCFYYEDNLRLLRDMGAELVEFSPLTDHTLPENLHGLYLGGGYPELYAAELSANSTMRNSVRKVLEEKLPCIAECGGFMYLTEEIGGHLMVGYLPGTCFDTGKLKRFGYVTLTAGKDNLVCRSGEQIPAHEFHHWDCTQPGDDFTAEKMNGKRWACVVANEHLYAGYPHFHFFANPNAAKHFYEACLKEREERD